MVSLSSLCFSIVPSTLRQVYGLFRTLYDRKESLMYYKILDLTCLIVLKNYSKNGIFLSAAALKKFERLSIIHREDCPLLVIPLYVMRNKVKEYGSMEDEDDFMMGPRFNDHFDDARFPLLV